MIERTETVHFSRFFFFGGFLHGRRKASHFPTVLLQVDLNNPTAVDRLLQNTSHNDSSRLLRSVLEAN